MTELQGVDVSSYQSVAQWRSEKPSFVIAKAQEGLSWHDADYATHRAAARADGLLFGAYSYVWPEYDAAACAKDFVSFAGLKPGEVGVIDFEPYKSKSAQSGWASWVVKFVAEFRSLTGANPWIYLNHDMATRLLESASTAEAEVIRGLPLWLAAYTTDTGPLHGWSTLTAWQYTDKPFDLDRFYGDADTWHKLGLPSASKPKPTPAPKPHVTLRIDGLLGVLTLNRWAAVMGTHTGKVALVKAVQTFLNAKGARDEAGNILAVDGIGIYDNRAADTPKSHTQYALQRYLGTHLDGLLTGPPTGSTVIKVLQSRLNAANTGTGRF